MKNQGKNIRFTLLLGVSVLLLACSQQKKTFTSLLWHNTNARYNSYFIAKEKVIEAENTLYEARKDNFNRVLKVYDPLEEGKVGSVKTVLDEAYKKASLPIQYHKNSKWVDNCYILIGKTNFYQMEFEKAIIAFKYVNTISDDEQDKAEALVWLARSFTATDQVEFAMGVLNHIRKIELNKKNTELLALAECELYQKLDYQKPFAKNIKIAAENATNKRNKSRSHFIAGQVFQEMGMDDEAYYHYKKCLSTNPPYELEFYSKLNMAQVTSIGSNTEIKKVKKYFKKLLRDSKNEDYKDKIYYEMAKFELKQNNIMPAVGYLNESVKNTTTNQNQRAYSYLLLGKIHYEEMQKYRRAAAYYDSTMMFLTKDEPDYEAIKKRTNILKDFVTQLGIIEQEDSLQVLAKMDTTELIDLLNFNIKKEIEEEKRLKQLEEEKKRKKEEAEAKKNAANNALNGPNAWYFYNAGSKAKGATEFLQKWGERALEDDWRRSNKEELLIDESETTENQQASADSTSNNTPEDAAAAEEQEIKKRRDAIIKTIPFSEPQLVASNKKIEDALSKLGNIYHLKLEELESADKTYVELLERFPNHKKKIEVYYILFLINSEINPAKAEEYKNLILSRFPESLYAKLVLDPDYLTKNWQLNKQAELLYDKAYKMYEAGDYRASVAQCDEINVEYPENYIKDKIALLKILNSSKINGIVAYKGELEAYIKKYKSSPLKVTAKEYLAQCNAYIEREINGGNTGNSGEVVQIYDDNVDGEQFFVIVLPQDQGLVMNDILVNMSDFHKTSSKYEELSVKHMLFNAEQFLIVVRTIKDNKAGLAYRDKIDVAKIIETDKIEFESFVITPDNFSKLYKTKALKEYSSFFKNNYF